MNAFCQIEIISIARIVWPFLMSLEDATALTFAIFANKKSSHDQLLHCSVSSTREIPRVETRPVNPFFPYRSLQIPRAPAQRRDNDDNCPLTSIATRLLQIFATRLQSTPSSTALLRTPCWVSGT